jgi:Trk K+ transport system NAD-binding subunit
MIDDGPVESASTLLVTLNDDDKNMLTTLLSRSMNPHLNIIVRANLDRSAKKLYRAGADYVTSLSTVGGQMLAKIVEKGVFEDSVLLSENVIISKYPVAGSGLEGRTIKETAMRTKTGCTIVGIMENGDFYPNPGPDRYLGKGMVVIVVGTIKQLEDCAGTYGLNRLP